MAGRQRDVRDYRDKRRKLVNSLPDIAPNHGCWEEAVEDLRRQFEHAILDPSIAPRDVAGIFVSHHASKRKLMTAVGVVLRSFACDEAMREDVASEARRIVLSNFKRHRGLSYEAGLGSFDSWLYAIWKNAVRDAVRVLKIGRHMVEYRSPDQLEPECACNGPFREDTSMPGFDELLGVIAQMPAGRMKEVMLDWAGGLSGVETAELRNVSQPRVHELRKKGFAFIRERLNLTPPVRSD